MSLLAKRWVQLMHIKKQIHHKDKELQKYKLLARKRLKALRQIRKQMAGAVNQLLADYSKRRKLSSRAQAKAQVARLLFIYQSSLNKWKKKNKFQQKKIRELRAQDDGVNESLRILRNRLRMHPRRKWIIANSLRRLRKQSNMRHINGDADVEIDPELFKGLLSELSCIERYLKDRKQKQIRQDDDNLSNVSAFLTSELLRKHVKKKKRHQLKKQNIVDDIQLTDEQENALNSKKMQSKFGKELAYKTLQKIESSVNSIIGMQKKIKVNKDQKTKEMMDMLIKANEQNLKMEQDNAIENESEIPKDVSEFNRGKKGKQLEPRYKEDDVIDRRFLPKVIYKRPSYRRHNRVPIQEEFPKLTPGVGENIKARKTLSSATLRKSTKRKYSIKERKLSGELENENETESIALSAQQLRLDEFKDLYQGIEYVNGKLKTKRNEDSSSNKSSQSRQSQRENKSLIEYINKRKSRQPNEDQQVAELTESELQLRKQQTYLQQVQHIKALQKLKHLSSHQQRQLRQLQEQVKQQLPQNQYIHHLQQLRKLQQKMRDGKPGEQSDEELNELLEAEAPQLPPKTSSQPVDLVAEKKFADQLEKEKSALKIIFEGLKEEGQPKDVAVLLRNKSVSDMHKSESYNDELTRGVSFHVSSKRPTVGHELMAKMALHNNGKIVEVQNILKDTITAPSLLDAMVDRNAIIHAVRNHDMWKTLYDLYENLKNVQIPQPVIYQMMRSQYLKFISEIVNEAIQNGAKTKGKSKAYKLDMRERRDSDSQDELERTSYSQAPNERKSAMSYSSMENDRVSAESNIYRDLKRMDDRYSVLVIQSILSAHSKYFEHLAAMEQASDAIQQVQQQMQEPKKARAVQAATAKPEKKRPSSCITRLFYEPRRTCRQRQADEECTPCECPSEAKLDVCIKCGAELTPLPESEPSSSRADLGLPDDVLAACMHNPEVLRATANICERCSFVHKPNVLCPSFKAAGDGATRLQQQLHLIKHHASSNRQHLEGCSCCCCCCQPAARHGRCSA
ncbi:PREDICTED: golgin subfamily B member 1 [Drosophila arizonae]|uniref:Golgin subfamily B member 1 n=1 Tax=Drosophila arizonae TaxID=7263 RepID=A0ABM1PNY8_DROAR|nr:PREDICTED: golgin subfamily B member 1 [Drosophila arizonae]